MIRGVLAIVLMTMIGGAAFYAGRVTAPSSPPSTQSVSQSGIPAAVPTPGDDTRTRTLEPPPSPPQITAAPPELDGTPPLWTSKTLRINLPIAGLRASDIQDTFSQSRSNGERPHEAIDIMAPRGTPVIAVTTGLIKKLFNSKPGGITVYQFDSAEQYCFYYAHLDKYAEGLREGQLVKAGEPIGYVGSTGNADPAAPHLHFAIFELGVEKRWYEGKPLNPYPFLLQALK